MFLGVVPTVANWSAKGDEFSLILDQNPLVDFVELPESHQGLFYSNIICGVIRGALEMVYPQTNFVSQTIKRSVVCIWTDGGRYVYTIFFLCRTVCKSVVSQKYYYCSLHN